MWKITARITKTEYASNKENILNKFKSTIKSYVSHPFYFQGDSGGPLACFNTERDAYELQGATSYGIACGNTLTPSGYVNVHFFKEWIEQFMET